MYDYTLYALGQLKVSGVTSNAYYVSGHVDLQRIYIVTLASTHRCIYIAIVCVINILTGAYFWIIALGPTFSTQVNVRE